MKWLPIIVSAGFASFSFCDTNPSYKVQLDPLMTAAGYANLQVDRKVSPVLSTGVMAWYLDKNSWGNGSDRDQASLGVRVDWFETGVFQTGWHSNAMVKVDFDGGNYARSRLKLTQSYQFVAAGLFMNVGIGAQFVAETSAISDSLYNDYQSWMLPAWEVSVGRAF